MFDMGCMLGVCLVNFLESPDGVLVVLSSLFIAVVSSLQLKRNDLSARKKTAWIYVLFFSILFPLVYFVLSVRCAGALACNADSVLKALLTAVLASIGLGYLVSPFLYRWMLKAKPPADGQLVELVAEQALALGIRPPRLFLLDDQKPIAFSTAGLMPAIFVSIGLTELLTRKEQEAVLLHELSHLKNSNQLFKFSSVLVKKLVPLSSFNEIDADLEHEERKADAFAAETQGTARFIRAAKRKADAFHSFDRMERCEFS